MPILKADISTVQIDEEFTLPFIDGLSRPSCWWRLLDAIVDEVSIRGKSELIYNGAGILLRSIPVDSGNRLPELLLRLLPLQSVGVSIYASCLLEGWDAATHPGGAACQLVIGGPNWPVEGML